MDERGLIYISIAETLRKRIQRGKYKAGRIPSERALAEDFGVNRLTARKALKQLERERVIHRKSTRGTYVGEHRDAKSLASGKKVLAFVLCKRKKMDTFHAETISHLEIEAGKRGWRLMLFQISDANEVASSLEPSVKSGSVDGIIFTGLADPATATAIRDLNLPTVLLGHLTYLDPIEEKLDRVLVDSSEYAAAATRYLLDRGFRKIALLNGPSYQIYQNITQGYMKALAEAGVPYREKLVAKSEEATALAGEQAMETLLLHEKPDAVFAADERIFQGASFAIVNDDSGKGRNVREIIRPTNNPGEDLRYPFATSKVIIPVDSIAVAAIETLSTRFIKPKHEPIVTNIRDFEIIWSSSISRESVVA
jgi:DNA-binding LacI/PurR family transcriptional regulator